MELKNTQPIRLFLYENVGPRAIHQTDMTSTQSHSDQPLRGLKRKSAILDTHEFLDLLESAIGELEKQDIIQANQMALRRS